MNYDKAYEILKTKNFSIDMVMDALDILFEDSDYISLNKDEIYDKLTKYDVEEDDAVSISELLT